MRLNSASAINTYNHCPRKFFFKYKQKLPEKPNINTLGGSIVHSAIKEKVNNPEQGITQIFDRLWKAHSQELKNLGLSDEQVEQQYLAFRQMALNWERDFEPELKIECEKRLISSRYNLIGFIDEVIEKDGKTILMENKTSRLERIFPEHKLQLAIYALLFQETYGRVP